MTFDWSSYLLGLVTLPAVALFAGSALALLFRALDKNLGIGACFVCDEGFTCEIGDYTRLGIWFRSRRHNWFVRSRRWHRDAWAANRWNPYRAPGVADDGRSAALRRPKPNVLRRAWWFVFR